MALVQETFDAIPKAPDDIAAAIVDCLLAWLPIFCKLNDVANVGVLQTLISSYIQHESPKCRLVALKYVEALVKSPALEFRWMLCQAYGDSRDEIRHEARRLLDLSISQPQYMPAFEDMAEYLHKKLQVNEESVKIVETAPDGIKKKKEIFADEVYRISAEYVFACAQVSAGHKTVIGCDNNDQLNAHIYADIFKYLSTVYTRNPHAVNACVDIVLQAISTNPLIHLLDIAVLLLHCNGAQINAISRERILEILRQYLSSSARASICSCVTRLFVVALNETERSNLFDEYLLTLQNNTNVIASTVWVCAYITSMRSEMINASRIYQLQQQLITLIDNYHGQPNALLESICAALSESLRRSPIALASNHLVELYELRDDEQLKKFIEQMAKLGGSRKDTITLKMRESAASSIGFLSSLNHCKSDFYETIINQLFSFGEGAPQPELQFTVGDALFDATFGEYSPSRRNAFIETETDFLNNSDGKMNAELIDERFSSLLNTIIDTKLVHTNRHLRQSALIWLFVLTKRGTSIKLTIISKYLNKIQMAFINALAEPNEFSQDVASKGMGVVFDMADESQKKIMIDELINALSSGRKMVTPVTPDTPIFEKGELGKAPGGENLTTYQELCSLATDLNQPELMYRFMQLANHNALWNSRKGAAFGFNVVLQQAKDELEPFLAKIVPKLFRYRYDPDTKVQHSMRTIWHTLTSSKKNVVEQYADEIFNELLVTLLNPLWRTRESSCLAISDLLSMNCTTKMYSHFGQLFEELFRVQDDVKESVRLAANTALKSLIKVSIRECSSSSSHGSGKAKSTQLIAVLLPALIDKGMRSVVKANRMFSLKAVMDLTKEVGSSIQPHLIVLVPCLLESLSETEPTVLNYLAARSTNEELEALDTARTGAAHTTPMMTTLYDMIAYVSEDILSALSTQLCELLRSSVGLTTRTGACQFIINLCLRQQQILLKSKPICDKLMQALFSGLEDRNPTIRKQFSNAISYLLKFCSHSQTDILIKSLKRKLQGDQEEEKMTVLHLLRSLSTNNNEFLSECSSPLIPHVFLATCQQVEKGDEAAKKKLEMWEEVWNEMITERHATIVMHRKEMIDLAIGTLKDNPIWKMKAQSAIMLARIVETIADDIQPSDADELYTILVSILPGRIWDGKVKVLETITILLQLNGEKLAKQWNQLSLSEERFAPLWKECKKKDRTYSAEAIICAAIFCEKTKNSTNAIELYKLIELIIAKQGKSSDSSSEDDSRDDKNNMAKSTARNAYLCRIVYAIPHLLIAFDKDQLDDGHKLVCSILDSAVIYWKVKQVLVLELAYLLQRWPHKGVFDMREQFEMLAKLVMENASQRRTFAQQCMLVGEQLIKGSLRGDWTMLRTQKLNNLIEALKQTDIVQSSVTFLPLLCEFCEKIENIIA